MTDRIIYQNSELYYYREGAGNKIMLLFHGFGQDHSAFEAWNDVLKNDYTIYTFDLYFHGNSSWRNPQAVKNEDWQKILAIFFKQEGINRFEIAGFSIGAKLVLATVELFSERIERIILLAPDGIAVNRWYSLATTTSLMRSFFRYLVLKPKPLHRLIQILRFLRLEDRNLLRFVEFQLSTEEKRRRVYSSWIYFRLLNFDVRKLTNLINAQAMPIVFIVGKMDSVIPAKKIKEFAKTLRNYQFHIIDARHYDLIEKGINYINLITKT